MKAGLKKSYFRKYHPDVIAEGLKKGDKRAAVTPVKVIDGE